MLVGIQPRFLRASRPMELRVNLATYVGRVMYADEMIVVQKYNRDAAVILSPRMSGRLIDSRQVTAADRADALKQLSAPVSRIPDNDLSEAEVGALVDRAVKAVRARKSQAPHVKEEAGKRRGSMVKLRRLRNCGRMIGSTDTMKPHTLTERENTLRTLEFRYPEWIPITVDLMMPAWARYGRELEELVLRHPLVFPGYRPGSYPTQPDDPFYAAYEEKVDDWGCVWRNTEAGYLGRVVGHPLADWHALDAFRAPDPKEQFDWPAIKAAVEAERRKGALTRGVISITQGGFFDRLQFLRGLENLLIDFAVQPPELDLLIEQVLAYNLRYIRCWLDIGIDLLHCHGDIGAQHGLMFSPAAFRKFLKPAYAEMFSLCRRAGAHVFYSSDGFMASLADDLIECGVTLHDPEVQTNTVQAIARAYQGRLCAMVQLDAQMLPTCSPEAIRRQVSEVVETLGSPQGGLMLYAYIGPDVPLQTIEALCYAYEEYCLP